MYYLNSRRRIKKEKKNGTYWQEDNIVQLIYDKYIKETREELRWREMWGGGGGGGDIGVGGKKGQRREEMGGRVEGEERGRGRENGDWKGGGEGEKGAGRRRKGGGGEMVVVVVGGGGIYCYGIETLKMIKLHALLYITRRIIELCRQLWNQF